MITVLAPNPSIDKLFVVDELVTGAIHRPTDHVAVPGGKGLTVARVARTLGAEVEVLGITAGTAGRWLVDALAHVGVPGRWVWAEGETRTYLSVAHGSDHHLTEFYEAGPVVPETVWHEFVEMAASDAPRRRWLVAIDSLPRGAPADGYLTLLGQADCRSALDTSGEPLRRALSPGVDLVKVNAAEAGDALDLSGTAPVPLAHLARGLQERCGAGTTVVVTGGIAGAVLVDTDGETFLARLPVTGAFPVGSGDAFLAGLLTARESHRSWPEALQLATATAAANAEQPGAGTVTLERVHELFEAVVLEQGVGRRG